MINGQEVSKLHETQISLKEFLLSYNQNIPATFPKVSEEQLRRFKREHANFFKNGEFWSLDQHRKKIIDWLPQDKDRDRRDKEAAG